MILLGFSFARMIGFRRSKQVLLVLTFINNSGYVDSLISVEGMDSAFVVSLLTTCSLFRVQLPFECINFFKKEGQRVLSGLIFGFKASLFLLFKFGDCSEISRVVVVLFAIVTPHVGSLRMLRRFASTIGNRFTLPYYLLVVKQDLDRWCV
jgi:hypothetical protein